MRKPLRVLIVEDSEDDATLVVRELRRAGYELEFERVDTARAMSEALAMREWDVILADYRMPTFDAPAALKLVQERGLDLPFIVVSGSIGEETAVAVLKEGAHDYVMKTSLLRLVPAVERELRDAKARRERREALEALRQSEEKYRLVVENAHDAIVVTQEGMVRFGNRSAVKMTGYTQEELLLKSFLELVYPEDRDLVSSNYSKRLRGEPVPKVYSFRIRRKDGQLVWVEITVVLISWMGAPATLDFLADITERKLGEERLRRALEGTIRALAATTEARDPYTAGHQERVTRVACAIGRALELDEEEWEGLRVAGLLHDVGKISIPAEILSKPTALTPAEIALVRLHPQTGHTILTGIDFPWPVGEIVLQHHERLNGSGYPNGLRGDEIRREAKVLGVADVVEAMVSHRPYRPALGLDRALAEISAGRGTLYDEGVVDACLKVFHEGRFRFD